MKFRKIISALSAVATLSVNSDVPLLPLPDMPLVAGMSFLETTRSREEVPYTINHSFNLQFPLTAEERERMTIPLSEFLNLHTDCDQKIYNKGTLQYAKNREGIIRGIKRRRDLEQIWTRHFNEQVDTGLFNMHPIDTTPIWHDLINGNSHFNNSFDDPRPRVGNRKEKHKAIDIFADRGSYIRSPVSGVVIASANDWKGSWSRKQGMRDASGGLGDLSGNGIGLFNPSDTSYHFLIHFNDVYVRRREVISRGKIIGSLGKTGNAIAPYVKTHLHLAYKKPGIECGVDGVLVAQNPYPNLRETRSVLLAARNGEDLSNSQ